MLHSSTKRRTRMNFMVDEELVEELKRYIPKGEWSDFINEVIGEAMSDHKHRQAFQAMEELQKSAHMKFSNKELLRLKNYGRE